MVQNFGGVVDGTEENELEARHGSSKRSVGHVRGTEGNISELRNSK